MSKLKIVAGVFALFQLLQVNGQKTDIPLGSFQYDLLDRFSVTSDGLSFTTFKPYERRLITQENLNGSDAFNEAYLRLENRELHSDTLQGRSERPFLKRFFQYESDLVSVSTKDFDFHLNPQLHFAFGRDSEVSENLFINTRGLELRGSIDQKVSFYTSLQENQMRLPAYVQAVQDTVGVIPYEGFWKSYDENAYDFLRAEGYVDFGLTRHLNAQFGFGRHFVGNGERSLILSDFSNRYPYLRLTTQIWKFKYTNLFGASCSKVNTVISGSIPNLPG